jgi:hypothetical protein
MSAWGNCGLNAANVKTRKRHDSAVRQHLYAAIPACRSASIARSHANTWFVSALRRSTSSDFTNLSPPAGSTE